MKCPLCKKNLDTVIFYDVEVDYCPSCLGMFFEKDELRLAKDKKDDQLRWLDIDLWKEKKDFKVKRSKKLCPACRLPFYKINYGDSKIEVDICHLCQGIWLDRGEFQKIINYLKEKAVYESLENWTHNLKEEFWEVFTGPEIFRDELLDFLSVLKILNYKLSVQRPLILRMIINLPK